jgi:RNA polymerase sigma-70 factor, ECF subfamily
MTDDNLYHSDETLIAEIQSGNKEAFEVLYRAYYSNLCTFLYRYIATPTICEELIQDLFMNIWIQRNTWNPKGPVSSYLYKSAKNRALDYLKHLEVEERYLKSQKISLISDEVPGHSIPESILSEENNCDFKELSFRVEKAILTLSPKSRMIFKLSRDDGLTYREIAEFLDISVKTVETQMGRALQKLRSKLTPFLSILLLYILDIMI